jgi:hypothetical protein
MTSNRQYHDATDATFKPLPLPLAGQLLAFVRARNVGKAIVIDGRAYTLEHISRGTNAFWRSRSFSVYFRAGRSVIRISDHWSRSNHAPRSQKLNCGSIRSCRWAIDNRAADIFEANALGSGRYPYRLIAGRCALKSFTYRPID